MTSPTDGNLLQSLFSDPDVAAVFGDQRFVEAMVKVESALARVQGRLGVIPEEAAGTVATQLETASVDLERLRQGTEKAGFPVIELLRQLQAQLPEQVAAYLHWGATTQDIMDTAMVLQMREAILLLDQDLRSLMENLAGLAERHRTSVMAGRTHSQQALPITFGLKVAGWLAPFVRHRQRLQGIVDRLLVVQLGGAAGTLASLGDRGVDVQEALASELGLRVPLMPWHSQRDNFSEMAGWLTLVSGSVGKLAQDIILLAQSEVAELQESSDPDRGGSSTMPQKRNPIQSERLLAAARVNASFLSSMHHSLIQEQERGTHGWQMEWLSLPGMFSLTSGSVKGADTLLQNLVVKTEKMKENVDDSRGLMMAEAVAFALTASGMDRSEAKRLVSECCRAASQEGKHLVDVVRQRTDAGLDWAALGDESAYLGSAEAFVDRVLAESRKVVDIKVTKRIV